MYVPALFQALTVAVSQGHYSWPPKQAVSRQNYILTYDLHIVVRQRYCLISMPIAEDKHEI